MQNAKCRMQNYRGSFASKHCNGFAKIYYFFFIIYSLFFKNKKNKEERKNNRE